MNHPKSMFQLSGVHYRVSCLSGFWDCYQTEEFYLGYFRMLSLYRVFGFISGFRIYVEFCGVYTVRIRG